MPIRQGAPITPPTPGDSRLQGFSNIIQNAFAQLFQAGHTHTGTNGPLLTAPKANDGNIGDVTIAIVSGSAYLFFKTDATTWYRLGPGTKIT
jgi:hypothetical protein